MDSRIGTGSVDQFIKAYSTMGCVMQFVFIALYNLLTVCLHNAFNCGKNFTIFGSGLILIRYLLPDGEFCILVDVLTYPLTFDRC